MGDVVGPSVDPVPLALWRWWLRLVYVNGHGVKPGIYVQVFHRMLRVVPLSRRSTMAVIRMQGRERVRRQQAMADDLAGWPFGQ